MSQSFPVMLRFVSDEGHGWLSVPLRLLDQLNLRGEISPYSYLSDTRAYLEEDRDGPLFLRAAEAAKVNHRVLRMAPSGGRSFVRSLPRFPQLKA